MPEWEEYFIRELKDRKILKRLNVFSTNTEFAVYAVTLKKGETQIAKVLTDGLESGEICIPNAKRDDAAFRDIETFTQYLNAFGKDIAKKIQATFKPVFNPAEESICPELNEVNEYIRQNTGYSLYEAQLAGAEAIKRQLKKEKMTMLVSGCGTGKTKIGSAALYAYQKSIGGGRRIVVPVICDMLFSMQPSLFAIGILYSPIILPKSVLRVNITMLQSHTLPRN